MKIQFRVLGAVLSMALINAASAYDYEPVEMAYDATVREHEPTVYTETCDIAVNPVVDERQNKDTIGGYYFRPIVGGDVPAWATEGLMNLSTFGYSVKADDEIATGGITIKPSITRAYTWHIGMKIFSMVVVKADFMKDGQLLQTKTYRAHGDKTNMWGADAEHVTTLNYSLNNLLPVMAKDLVDLCQGRMVAARSYAGPDNPDKQNTVKAPKL